MRKLLILGLALLSVFTWTAWGQLIDPATLHIGTGAGTPCATGCGGDPNQITQTNFDVYQNAAGANTLTSPLLVILGIPNYTGTALTINSVTAYSPYAGVATGGTTVASFGLATTDLFGGTWTTNTTSAQAVLSASSTGDAYSVLGLSDANNSNNFGNWSGFDSAQGVAATSFGLYVYRINANLVAGGLFNITFNAANSLPIGTIAIAYGCQPSTATSTGSCTESPNTYNTPFTEAGGTTGIPTTPEPSAIFLLGSSLLGIGAIWRKRQKAPPVS